MTAARKKRAPAATPPMEDTQARRIAADILQRAARWLLALHPIGPELRPELPRGAFGNGAVIRFDPPGVLRVFDAASGELLAESISGEPGELSPDFTPSSWRL